MFFSLLKQQAEDLCCRLAELQVVDSAEFRSKLHDKRAPAQDTPPEASV